MIQRCLILRLFRRLDTLQLNKAGSIIKMVWFLTTLNPMYYFLLIKPSYTQKIK